MNFFFYQFERNNNYKIKKISKEMNEMKNIE